MRTNIILEQDQFIRSVEISGNDSFATFLGAGASITSGIPSAADCIWDWKRRIFLSKTGRLEQKLDIKSLPVRDIIQKWLNSERVYPSPGSAEEYSYYVESCYPIDEDRRKFFQRICAGKNPSVGYKLLCLLHEAGLLSAVWTTNFDDLTSHAAIQANLLPVDMTLDTVERIFRAENSKELLIVKLHGDYKYGALKNTDAELEKQDETFRERLIEYVTNKHLIVTGYSGRDQSVMEALTAAYSRKGAGRLYWCGYGREVPKAVEDLIHTARDHGRTAYYIPTDGFDSLMVSLGRAITKENEMLAAKYSECLKANRANAEVPKFSIDSSSSDTVIKSNLFEIAFPQEVFQFEMTFTAEEKPWQTLRQLTEGMHVVAVPFKRMVYAIGTLSDINRVFAARINGPITRVSIADFNIYKDSAFHSLLLSGVTDLLAKRANVLSNKRDLIWRPASITQHRIGNIIYTSHSAVRLAITTDGSRYFLSFMPDFYLSSETGEERIGKEIYQEVGRRYYDKMRNAEFNAYIMEWRALLLPDTAKVVELEYPASSGSGLYFKIRRNNAFARINLPHTTRRQNLSEHIPADLILHHGVQFAEPQLVFSPAMEGMNEVPHDFHPMRGITSNKPYDYRREGTIFEDDAVRLGIICPEQDAAQFSAFLKKQNGRIETNGVNKAYLLPFPGFNQAFATQLKIPDPGTDNWLTVPEPTKADSVKAMAADLRNHLLQRIDGITADGIKKVVLLYIPNRWLEYTSYDLENEQYDLHDFIKAYCAERGIATQFIQEETLTDKLQCQINWWLSLSYYVKSMRTPWVLDALDKSTAFAGIGYSVNRRNGDSEIVMGCSHIYNSQGQGLKYRLSKVEDPLFWDKQKCPHLSYKDAFKFGTSIIDMFYHTMDEFPKRVVIHKRTYFTKEEMEGLKDSLLGNGIAEVDLIEINFEDDMRYVASKPKYGGGVDINGYPVPRGTCVLVNGHEALLWTHGVVPSVENPNQHFYLGGRFIPGPLRIRKHYGNSNIGLLATEILGLTKMNWNSFDLYSQLPATVNSSNVIARIGRLLSKREGANYDYRYFI